MSRATEWFLQSRALADAEALIAQETPEHRARREECRALYDAAEQLSVSGARSEAALNVLHQRGLEASQDTAALPAFLPHAHAIVLQRLEEPQRARTAALSRRLYRLSGVALVVLLAAWGGEAKLSRALSGPNLLAGARWKTSSTLLDCLPAEHRCGGLTTDIFFHTRFEANPWVQYDLGAVKPFSKLSVKNRQDLGPERAVPLVAEISDDAERWQPVARRDQSFSEWTVSFPPVKARYLRLRAERVTWLHLEAVELFE